MAIVSHWAGAAVGAQAIGTGASILTGLRVALILLKLAKFPVKTKTATAREGVDVISASPAIQTGAGGKAIKRVVIDLPLRPERSRFYETLLQNQTAALGLTY